MDHKFKKIEKLELQVQGLKCPSCKQEIPAEHININNMLAKCSDCNTVFNFQTQIKQLPRFRPEVVMPYGIESYHFLDELNIELNWRSSASSFLIFFTIIWNAFLAFFVMISLFSESYEMLLFISIHLLVGVGLIYYSLASFINKTYLTIDANRIVVEHKPLKMPLNRDRNIDVRNIEQLFSQKYSSGTTNGQPTYAFKVVAQLIGDEKVDLVKGLKSDQQALYIEQQIENYLDIPDRPVDGEFLA